MSTFFLSGKKSKLVKELRIFLGFYHFWEEGLMVLGQDQIFNVVLKFINDVCTENYAEYIFRFQKIGNF